MARDHDQSKIKTIEYNKGKTKAGDSVNARWWLIKDEQIFEHLFPLVRDIELRQLYRRTANLRYARLYSNMEILGFYAGMANPAIFDQGNAARVTLNVVKACIDTVGSKIAKSKPRPMFLTDDGNWSEQERAKKLTKFVDGAFDEMGYYLEKQKAFRDSEIFGTGAVKFFKKDGKVACERSMIDELIVDDAESIYGTPQSLHQVRYVNRDILLESFPAHEIAIKAAACAFSANVMSPAAKDVLRVVESWHLKSGKKAKDGKHAIVLDGATLFAESYESETFPFEFMRWSDRITGFYGIGIAEELIGIQMEINKMLATIKRAQDLMCVPRVWIESSSAINTNGITNEIGGTGIYTGTPPTFTTAPGMSPEVYSHLQMLYQKAFEIVGVSQLSATAKKPAGLDSGIALREYQDIESERFQLVNQRYDDGALAAAAILIEKTEEMSVDGTGYRVKVKGSKGTRTLSWKDVRMDQEDYVMRAFPTSILPTTPAGRLQTTQELTQAGFIDKDQAMDLLDFPDLEAYMSTKNAPVDLVKKIVEGFLERGEYQTPEPYMNLQMSATMVQYAYIRAKLDNVPEEKLDLFRRFMDDCQALITQASAPPEDPMAMDPSMDPSMAEAGMDPMATDPMAAPEAQPVSDLVPNVPVEGMV